MHRPMFYSAFGLQLEANRPVPALVSAPPLATSTRRVRLDLTGHWPHEMPVAAQQLWYVSPWQNEDGHPILHVWQVDGGAYYRLLYSDGTAFIVDRCGTRVWAAWPETMTLEDTATYLLGPVLGFVLRLRGTTCLHASAIAIGDRAIALLGPAEAGKSTTAAAFAERGYRVLSDDIVALSEQRATFLVQPAYPRLRLWPESVHALYGSADALPRLTPTWDKRYLDLTQPGYQFQPQPLPLAAIYMLGERRADAATPYVEAVPAPTGLLALVANTYVNYLLDKAIRSQEFETLSRVVTSVPLRRVTPHTDPSYLSRLCDVILDDLQTSTPSAPAVRDTIRGAHV